MSLIQTHSAIEIETAKAQNTAHAQNAGRTPGSRAFRFSASSERTHPYFATDVSANAPSAMGISDGGTEMNPKVRRARGRLWALSADQAALDGALDRMIDQILMEKA
jgi:hypothetical protein